MSGDVGVVIGVGVGEIVVGVYQQSAGRGLVGSGFAGGVVESKK